MTGTTWTIKGDVPAVFRNAIAEGRFINANHASGYMYMYTDGEGVDQFKHIDSRQYLIHRAGTFRPANITIVEGASDDTLRAE